MIRPPPPAPESGSSGGPDVRRAATPRDADVQGAAASRSRDRERHVGDHAYPGASRARPHCHRLRFRRPPGSGVHRSITARGSVPAVEHAVLGATQEPTLVAARAAPAARRRRRWRLLLHATHRESEATAKPAVAKPADRVATGREGRRGRHRRSMRPGSCRRAKRRNRRRPIDGAPVIGDGPCKLDVDTTPAGSMVPLDDKVIAPSPLTIATTCEKHKLDISHARYQTVTKLVSLAEARAQDRRQPPTPHALARRSRASHLARRSSSRAGAQERRRRCST